MYLQTLGKLALVGGEVSRPKVLTMLAYLSLEGAKDRGHLGDLFYMGASDPRSSLRISLKHVRDLAEGVLSSEQDWVSIEIASDASDLLNAIESQDYQKTVELYQGAFLEGFRVKGAGVELEEWVFETREYLALGVRQAMLELSTQVAKEGDFTQAGKLAAQAFKLAGAPEPEPEQFRQLHALMLAGDAVEVLELKKLATEYDFELNLSKQEAKNQFYKAPPKPDDITESTSPELAEEALQNPVATKPTNMRPRNNLFVGRSKELQEITSLLTDEHRLVTLHGQGGIGKTRLVTRLGLELLKSETFPDGIFFVALENLSDGSQIVPAITNSLGVTLSTEKDELDALAEQIADKNMLIIMDNFEHLMDSATICSDLLKRSTHAKFLVSSREGLNLAGEVVYEVNGFSPPTSEQLSMELALEYDIIQLFIDRAKHANLSYKLSDADLPHVIKICQMVEGLPLGVELAAAGLRYMPIDEIAETIAYDLDTLYMPARDKAERHHSIRATIEYSWKLLSAKEQQVLVNMAVFRGGFSRDAANKVAGASLPILRSLVDKALLRTTGDGRFTMHMLLYQYTVEKFLQDPNHVAIQEKHANYFMHFSEEAEPQLIAEKQVEWLNKLEAEHENLRIALQWNLENDIEAAMKQSAALRRFWEIRGYFIEGEDWYTSILKKTPQKNTKVYLKTLYAVSALLRAKSEIDVAKTYLEECMQLAQQLEEEQILADTFNQLAGISWATGNLDSAHQQLEKSLVLKRLLQDKRGIAIALNNLGLLASSQKNYVLANTLYKEALQIYEQLKDDTQIIHSLISLGRASHRLWIDNSNIMDLESSKKYFEKALDLNSKLGNKQTESNLYVELSFQAIYSKNLKIARNYALAAIKISEDLNLTSRLVFGLNCLGVIEYLEGNLEKSEKNFKKSIELSLNNQLLEFADGFEGLTFIEAERKNYQYAAFLLSAANKYVKDFLNIQTYAPKMYPKRIQNVHSVLGDELVDRLKQKALEMDVIDIVDIALNNKDLVISNK